MRSCSRRPWLSNRHSSTFSALAENSAKLVPRPSQVAPSRCGVPVDTPLLALWNQENCRERREGKADLWHGVVVQRVHPTAVPDVAAAVDRSIGIENLAPAADERHLDPIVAPDLRREIHRHQAARPRLPALAHPHEHAVVDVLADQPFEAVRLAVELMQRRQRAIEAIEIADQRLNAGVSALRQQMPVERMTVAPFLLLRELVPHEVELLARMAEHEAVIGAQVGEALPVVAR